MDLYIDNVRADVLRTSFAINWRWYDIENPLKRYAVASTNMTLPFSAINNNIFSFTNIAGSDLTPVWDEVEAKIYFGNYLALAGLLKLNNIDITKKQFNTSIKGDNNVINDLNANTPRDIMSADMTANIPVAWNTLSLAIDSLNSGSYGWLLPVIDDGTNLFAQSGATLDYEIISVNDLRRNELWISLDNFITRAFSSASIDLKIFESGSIVNYSASSIKTIWANEYMPAYHIGLKASTLTPRITRTDTESRYFNSGQGVITNANIIVCGGLDTFDVFKEVCRKFNMGIYIDQIDSKIIMFDLNTTNTPTIDWSDKLISHKKTPLIKNYAKTNYIKFKPTDNLDDTFGQITLLNNPAIKYIKDTKTLGTINVAIPGVYDYYGTTGILLESNIFKLDYFSSKGAYNSLVLLNKSNLSAINFNVTVYSIYGNTAASKQLYKMSFLDSSSYFNWIEDKALDISESYDTEIELNLSDLVDLRPWNLVKVKQIGEEFYINEIKNLNFNRPAKVKLIKLA